MWDHVGPLKCPAGGRLTYSTNTFTGTYTLSTVTFGSLGFLLVERTVWPIQTPLTCWFEFRSRNSWLTACFLLPYAPSAPFFLSFYIQITHQLSPPSLLPNVCVCVFGAAMEAIDR